MRQEDLLMNHSAWALLILGTVLRECWVLPSMYDYYNFVITYIVFFNIGQWLLLFIQVWGVNRMLSKRLGSGQAVVKIATLAITGVMAALTAGYTGISCYNRWTIVASSGYSRYMDLTKMDDERKLAVAYWVLYLLSVIAGGAISGALLMQIRSKSIAINVSEIHTRNTSPVLTELGYHETHNCTRPLHAFVGDLPAGTDHW